MQDFINNEIESGKEIGTEKKQPYSYMKQINCIKPV